MYVLLIIMWPTNWPGNVRGVLRRPPQWLVTGIRHSRSPSVLEAVPIGCGLLVLILVVHLFLTSVLEHLFQIFYTGVQSSHPCAIRVVISLASVRELLIMLSTMAVFISTSWWRCGWKYNRSSRSFFTSFSNFFAFYAFFSRCFPSWNIR